MTGVGRGTGHGVRLVIPADSVPRARAILAKRIPEVPITLWLVNVLSTATGATAADYQSSTLGPGLPSASSS